MMIRSILAALVLAGVAVGGAYWVSKDETAVTLAPLAKEYRPKISPTGPYPEAVVDEAVFAFGSMILGDTGEHNFVITNEGEAPLELMKGRKTCKCTKFEIKKKKLAPGESTNVYVEYKPDSASAVFRQTLNVLTNDPEHQILVLELGGTVDRLLTILPKGDWDLGDVESEVVETTGLIASRVLDDLELIDLKASDPAITLELNEATEADMKDSKTKSGYELTVRLAPTVAPGPFRGLVTFGVAGHVDRYEFGVRCYRNTSLQFMKTAGIRFVKRDNLIDLGGFPSAKGKTGRLDLYLRGGEEMNATDIECSPPFLKCEFSKDDTYRSPTGKRYHLKMNVPPGSPSGAYTGRTHGTITLKTDHPEYPELKFLVNLVILQ